MAVRLPPARLSIPLVRIAIALPFLVPGLWFGVRGVADLGISVSETHRPERIVTSGVYGVVRHPQYLGGLLPRIGITVLLAAWYSLLTTPLVVVVVYVIPRKEDGLVREFGEEDRDYQEVRVDVPSGAGEETTWWSGCGTVGVLHRGLPAGRSYIYLLPLWRYLCGRL